MSSQMFMDSIGEGGRLFGNFVDFMMKKEFPSLYMQCQNLSGHLPDDLVDSAEKLKEIANDFLFTPKRQDIKNAALQVVVEISKPMLSFLLRGILDTMVTEETKDMVMTAFFYLYDILMRVIMLRGQQVMNKFFTWCKQCIHEIVDPIVEEAGGWKNVLGVVLITLGAVAAVAGIVGLGYLIGKMLTSDKEDKSNGRNSGRRL